MLELDPTLAEFVANNTDDVVGELVWKADACAVFRPGGCFNATKFLQHFYEYMGKQLGTYTSEAGKEKPCLRVKTKEVVGVELEATEAADHMRVSGLHVKSPGGQAPVSSAGPDVLVKKDKHPYLQSDYAFCTGEAVGVLDSWGLADPLAARFGGAVLKLHLPIPPEYVGVVPDHCMELHQQGVVLVWQVRPEPLVDGCPCVFIGVGGTKAYYEKVKPDNEQAFAKFRHPFHLNQVNMMYPKSLLQYSKNESI